MPLRVRPPIYPQPHDGGSSISSNTQHKVVIYHPGYRVHGGSKLLTLTAFDRPEGGIHYASVLTVCGLVVGNRWDCFLAKDAGGREKADRMLVDGILPTGEYFLHLPPTTTGWCTKKIAPTSSESCADISLLLCLDQADDTYPIVPTFRQWIFPHGNLPPSWQILPGQPAQSNESSANSSAPVIRDEKTCHITGHTEGCEKAHLCPISENDWFHKNEISRYISDPMQEGDMAINNVNNFVTLRSDIHKSFDDRKITFIPKEGQIVAHVLRPNSQLGELYHNVPLYSASVSLEFFLVRLAWSIFAFIEGFLQAGQERVLLCPSAEGYNAYLASRDKCRELATARTLRSRSSSPKKRSRQASIVDSMASTVSGFEDDLDDCSFIAIQEDSFSSIEDAARGRKVQRSPSPAPYETMNSKRLKQNDQRIDSAFGDRDSARLKDVPPLVHLDSPDSPSFGLPSPHQTSPDTATIQNVTTV